MTTLAPGSATSQPLPKEGIYDYASCFSGTSNGMQFSKTHGAYTLEYIGNTRTNPPADRFDMLTYHDHCMGQGSTIGGKSNNLYYCQAADKNGDKFMLRGVSEGAKGQQQVIAGTGKHEGMERTAPANPGCVPNNQAPRVYRLCSPRGAGKMK
ncbi:MAG: hypothetical protein JJD98_03240 [Polaromonas sp.]|nr:hypothetical protein [Polaromonas sp.]